MAPNPNFPEVLTATLQKRLKGASDNIGTSTFMLAKLEATKQTLTGFRTIVEDIKYARNTSGKWFSGYEPLPLEQQKLFTSIENPWSQFVMNISFSGLELKQNRGEAAILNLMSERIDDVEQAHREDYNAAIVTADGSDPKMMHGLPLILGQGAYGGIDPAVAGSEFWLPYTVDPRQDFIDAGGSPAAYRQPPLTWDRFMEMAIRIDNGRSRPDTIMLSPNLYIGMLRSLEQQFTFQNPKLVELNIEHVTYMGMDLAYDFDIPDGTWYALNSDHLTWWRQEGCFMDSTGFKTPIDQDSQIAHILSMHQITTNKRMAHAVGYDFKPAA